MSEKKTTPPKKAITWEEHISIAMETWKKTIATEKGFEFCPFASIRIDPNVVDRTFFEKGAVEWIKIYYQNHRPLIINVDRVYRRVSAFMSQKKPSVIKKLNTVQKFELLCCVVWLLLIVEEYGSNK